MEMTREQLLGLLLIALVLGTGLVIIWQWPLITDWIHTIFDTNQAVPVRHT